MTQPGAGQRTVALSIVVPAYNEAANIGPVVDEVLGTFSRNAWLAGAEIVLVDDGSRDGTGQAMDALARRHDGIVVVHHSANRGFGAALASGFAASHGVAVGFVTADGEVPSDQIIDLYRALEDNDLVLSRRQRTVGVDRRVLTWGFDLTARLILGFWLDKDVGIYLVRGSAVRAMTFQSSTGLMNLEMMLQLRAMGGRTVYAPGFTLVRPRLSGQSKVTNLRTVLRTLWEMVKLRVALIRRRTPDGGLR